MEQTRFFVMVFAKHFPVKYNSKQRPRQIPAAPGTSAQLICALYVTCKNNTGEVHPAALAAPISQTVPRANCHGPCGFKQGFADTAYQSHTAVLS